MPDQTDDVLDNVVEANVSLDDEETDMPADLSPNVANHIFKTGSEAYQALMTDISHNGAHVHNLTRSASFKHYNELGSIESRANSGILGTPVATPTQPQQ